MSTSTTEPEAPEFGFADAVIALCGFGAFPAFVAGAAQAMLTREFDEFDAARVDALIAAIAAWQGSTAIPPPLDRWPNGFSSSCTQARVRRPIRVPPSVITPGRSPGMCCARPRRLACAAAASGTGRARPTSSKTATSPSSARASPAHTLPMRSRSRAWASRSLKPCSAAAAHRSPAPSSPTR
jgi:hypothetical protein